MYLEISSIEYSLNVFIPVNNGFGILKLSQLILNLFSRALVIGNISAFDRAFLWYSRRRAFSSLVFLIKAVLNSLESRLLTTETLLDASFT